MRNKAKEIKEAIREYLNYAAFNATEKSRRALDLLEDDIQDESFHMPEVINAEDNKIVIATSDPIYGERWFTLNVESNGDYIVNADITEVEPKTEEYGSESDDESEEDFN